MVSEVLRTPHVSKDLSLPLITIEVLVEKSRVSDWREARDSKPEAVAYLPRPIAHVHLVDEAALIELFHEAVVDQVFNFSTITF